MLYLILLPLLGGFSLLWLRPKHLELYCYTVVGLTGVGTLALPLLHPAPISVGKFPYGATFAFSLDSVGIFFSFIFVVVWFCVLRYSFEYLAHDSHKKRFLAFYLSVLGAMLGVCYSANLITLYMCFEGVTLTCFPLIAHKGTEDCLRACKKYIFYSLGGALLALISVFYFYSLDINPTFTPGGIPGLANAAPLVAIHGFFAVAILGFGCKAGLFPLHGWLKTAHPIAPTPASAVLSGITTKAGVIAILRVTYFVVGPELISDTPVQSALLSVTLLTILMGSMLACRENVLKARLAYSTVSQVSYILFALLLCNKLAFLGALLHALFHALAKNTLFLSAGTMIHETDRHNVNELRGLGTVLRPTFLLFTVASLSLVGVPFFGGFVSKWYLAIGSLTHSQFGIAGVAVIMISALLTAYYLLSISVSALLPREDVPLDVPACHSSPAMSSPTLALLTVALGIYPAPIIAFLSTIADQVL